MASSYYSPWTVLIFVSIPISYCGYKPENSGHGNPYGTGARAELTGLYPGPYFDLERNQPNISAHVGTHAYLPCYVKQLGNKSVSWIRKEDSHIVSVDRYTFIADERFNVIAAPGGESWVLQIKYVQPRDAGIFECQISTEPKLAYHIRLMVLVPNIKMDTTDENMFVWEGSQVQLRCIINNTLISDNLGKIAWFRDNRMINKNDPRKGIVFQAKVRGSAIVETATFPTVRKSDTGNYTCSLISVGSASVALHVLSGENPAAMHHGRGISTSSFGTWVTRSGSNHVLTYLLILFQISVCT